MAGVTAPFPGWDSRATLKVGLQVEAASIRKSTERMVTHLQRSSTDAKSVGEAVKKLSKQPRVTQIQVFQRLLDQHDCELALPVYESLRKQRWYKWCPTSYANLAALLASGSAFEENLLEAQRPENLDIGAELDLRLSLLSSYGKHGHLERALAIFSELQSECSPRSRCLSYRALLHLHVYLDQPHKGYLVLQQMKTAGFVPSLDDYKGLLHQFGKGGNLAGMESLNSDFQRDGMKLDLSGFNMKLSAYAQAMKSDSVRETLESMSSLSTSWSVNSCNAISKSCPALLSTIVSLEKLPLSEASLLESLNRESICNDEFQLVQQLVALGLPSSSVKWEDDVWELDLHQMFLGTAFLAVLLWFIQLKLRLESGPKFPPRVQIVTGWGKHSGHSGQSPVVQGIVLLLDKVQSPFLVEKQNKGLLSCQVSAVRRWLLKFDGN